LIFNDYAVLVKNAPGNKMNVRKVMSLTSLRVEPPKKDDKKRTLLELEYIKDNSKASDKIFIGCEDAAARAELLHILALAITEAMNEAGVPSPDAHSRVKGTAFSAVLLDDGARLEEIITAGTNANVVDASGQSLLSVALQAGRPGLASLLLQRGADPNVAAVSPCGLLHDDTHTLTHSIAPLARAPAASERCTRLLHVACSALALDAVKLLLSRGADVHALDDRGLTPLACAARAVMPGYRQDEAEAGAGDASSSSQASTPTSAPRAAELAPVAAWTASLEGLSGRAQQRLAGEVVKALADRGADVDEADSAQKTLLMHSAHKDSVPLVTALVDAKAGLSALCSAGLTALHYAAKSAAVDAARVLLQHGAGANLRDSQGNTPMHLCTDLPTVKVLIEHGAR
jgi:ankyrin repeat protein